MAAPTTTSDALLQNALGPASVSIDGRGSVTAKNADDIIKARRELANIANESADADFGFGLRYGQIVPPGGG